jgi:hypothetical protein
MDFAMDWRISRPLVGFKPVRLDGLVLAERRVMKDHIDFLFDLVADLATVNVVVCWR